MNTKLDRFIILMGLVSLCLSRVFPDQSMVLIALVGASFGWCFSVCRQVDRLLRHVKRLEKHNLLLRQQRINYMKNPPKCCASKETECTRSI